MIVLAMGTAVAVGGGELLVSEAAVSAILIATLPGAGGGLPPERFLEALIGGGVALAVTVLLPPDPVLQVGRALNALWAELGGTLGAIARALETGDATAAERALETARGLDHHVGAIRQELLDVSEAARFSPPRRRARGTLARVERSLPQVDFAVRDTRVLARNALRYLRGGDAAPAELSEAVARAGPGRVGAGRQLRRRPPRRGRPAASPARRPARSSRWPSSAATCGSPRSSCRCARWPSTSCAPPSSPPAPSCRPRARRTSCLPRDGNGYRRAMGEDVAATVFSREDRQRYRQKVKRCLDVFARMLSESRFEATPGSIGPGDRAQPDRRGRRPGDAQREGARGDRRRRLPDRARAVQRRDQRRAALARGRRVRRAGARRPHEPQQRRGEGARRRRAHGDGRDPADGHRRPPRRRVVQRQPALPAAQRADLRRPRGGPGHQRSPASSGCRRSPTRWPPRPRARACSCTCRSTRPRSARTGTPPRRSPASSSRWPPTRRSSSARSCGGRRGSRCSSRPPTRARRSCAPRACARACGSGSAGSPRSSTSSRRTSATSRRCCRCARTRTRSRCSRAATSPGCRSCGCTTGPIYRWNRPIYDVVRGLPHLRVENRVLPAGPTVADILANAAFYYGLLRALVDQDRPLWSQMSFAAAEENFHAGARDGIEANVYWPGVGEVPVAELVLRRLLPMAHEGLETLGRRARGPRAAAGYRRTAVPEADQRRRVAGGRLPPALRGPQARPRGRAAGDDRRATASSCTPTSRCTPGRRTDAPARRLRRRRWRCGGRRRAEGAHGRHRPRDPVGDRLPARRARARDRAPRAGCGCSTPTGSCSREPVADGDGAAPRARAG